MKSLAYIPASDGAANASLMTIQSVRTAPATTIIVNTTAGVPAKFYGTMGTPHTFTDPVTGETITVISEASAVDFAGRIDSGKIEIDAIAPGYTDLGSKVGDIIVIRPVTEWSNNIFNVLSEAHEDDGSLKADSVPTAAIQDNAVTANKLGSGVWRVVATGGQGTVIPPGYKDYRITIAADSTAPGSNNSVDLNLSGKSGTAYTAGLQVVSTTVSGIAFSVAGTYIARVTPPTTSAQHPIAELRLSRDSTSSVVMKGIITASGGGSDYWLSSKVEFSLANAATIGALTVVRSGSTVSNVRFIVEALGN